MGLGPIVVGSSLADRHGWWKARRPLRFFGLDLAPLGLSVTPWLIAFGLGALVLFGFRLRQRVNQGRTPLVESSVFSIGRFLAGFTTDALQSVTLAGLLFVFPLFLQQTLGLDALGAGMVLFPVSVSVLAASLLTTSWSRWIHAKYLVVAGAGLMAVGVGGMISVLEPGMSEWGFTGPLVIFGLGTGLILAQVPNLTMSAVRQQDSEDAAGIQNSAKELGTSLGTAIIGSVLLVATMTGVVAGIADAKGIPYEPAALDAAVVAYEDAIDEMTVEEQQAKFAEFDASVNGQLSTITNESR